MEKPQLTFFHLFILVLIMFTRMTSHANPTIQPTPPHLSSKAYLLIDANSEKVLAQKNADKRIPPASLTKMMTMYVVSQALKRGEIHLDDQVRISKQAWQTGGSKMFVREGQLVSVKDLIQGIIVDSGNDACVAMAEHLAGSEKNFAYLMNHHAKALGMTNSHFTDSTGLPHKNHYSSAADLAILAQALIKEFPDYYPWYKQKWFTFNKIKQPNRNRLLWRDRDIDGIKTGHTKEAGYCLVSSARKDNMRLIAVLLGAPSETARGDSSQRLLDFGFRFYSTHKLFDKENSLSQARVWKGKAHTLNIGLIEPAYVTIPKGKYQKLEITTSLPSALIAPIKQGQLLGTLRVSLEKQVILERPIVALEANEKGGFLARFSDGIRMRFSQWFG